MAYLGKTPSQAVRSRYFYTATGGETSLSGADNNGDTLIFADGNYVDVYLNGVLLVAGTDYNVNTTNTIAGLAALTASDIVEIVVYDTFSVFGGTFQGALAANSINLGSSTTVSSVLDEDAMTSDSATALATQQSIKAYVDTQVATVPVGDITEVTAGTGLTGGGASGAVTLNVVGGTGITANADNIAIDATVATLTGTQTLTNKTLGATSVTADVSFGDNNKVIFGAGNDLQIYHNGFASAITDAGSGDLFLGGDNNVLITNAALNETKAKFISNAGVALYYDNNLKFVTTSTGVDVTGTVTADGLNVEILDNDAGPVTIQQGGNSYFKIVTTNSSESVQLGNSTTNPDILLGSGYVGIGTSLPSRQLHINNASESNFRLQGGANYAELRVKDTDNAFSLHFTGAERLRIDASGNAFMKTSNSYIAGTTSLGFYGDAASSNGMFIDSSGNVLVGTSSYDGSFYNDSTGSGFVVRSDGKIDTKVAGTVANMNRTGSDGDILYFARSGAAVGSIGVAGGDLFISGGSSHAGIRFDTNILTPVVNTTQTDATVDLGYSSQRFKDLYLSGGVYLGGTAAANALDDYETGSWNPVITSNSGSISSYTASGTYTKIGNSVVVMVDINIANIGTAGGFLRVATLPFSAITSVLFSGFGRERNVTGYNLSIDYANQTAFLFQRYDGSFLGGNGYRFLVTAVYEAA